MSSPVFKSKEDDKPLSQYDEAIYGRTFEPGKMYMLQSHYGWPISFLRAQKKTSVDNTGFWDLILRPEGGYESLVVEEPTPFIVVEDFNGMSPSQQGNEAAGISTISAHYITGLIGEKVCFISKLDIGLHVEMPPEEENVPAAVGQHLQGFSLAT